MKRYWKAACAVLAGVMLCGMISTMALKNIDNTDSKSPVVIVLQADEDQEQALKVGEKLKLTLPDGVKLKPVKGNEENSGSGDTGSGEQQPTTAFPWIMDSIVMPEGSTEDSPVKWTDKENYVLEAVANGTVTIAAAAENGAVYACKITVDGYAITDITITSEDTGILMVGETRTLTASLIPDKAEYEKLEWTSEDTSVVTVEAKADDPKTAVITAHESGTATIVLTVDGYQAEYEVTVHSEIHLFHGAEAVDNIQLRKGETYQLRAAASVTALTLNGVKWTSSDANIVSVDNTGRLSALADGEAVITATSIEGETATCRVSVSGHVVNGITLDHTVLSMTVGGTAKLNATIAPQEAAGTVLGWISSNAAVARVDQQGNITAIAAGTAAITASADGVSAVCTVTVRNAVVPNTTPATPIQPSTVITGGITGGSGILYMPSTIVPVAAVRQYTMPTFIPTAAFLTIDSNADASTESILTVLRSYHTKATFFVPVGDLYANDDLLRHIAGDGHSIGLLLNNDQTADSSNAIRLLNEANKQLEVITGTPTRLVRVSGGSAGAVGTNGLADLSNAGYRLWDWNAAANEETSTAANAYQGVSSALNRTGIVSIRFGGSDNTAAVLRELLPYMNYCAIPARAISAGDTPICQVTAAG